MAIVGGTQLLLHPDMCMTMSASGYVQGSRDVTVPFS